MLSYLKKHHIDLIYTTSKTRKECLLLQKKMGIEAPFIVENGACVYYPDGKRELLGRPHEEIADFIDRYKRLFHIKSFKDMSIDEIAQHTGFSKEQATLAKEREYSEPFLIDEKMDIEALQEIARKEGFKILRGGRFYHCVGAGQDKGKAVKKVLKHYNGYRSIALGDNFNDIAMLEVVDIPILIPRYGGEYIPLSLPNLLKAPYEGSLGWSEALKQVLPGVA
jgi:mannosyl-3-phosphoglycerate phosphatase